MQRERERERDIAGGTVNESYEIESYISKRERERGREKNRNPSFSSLIPKLRKIILPRFVSFSISILKFEVNHFSLILLKTLVIRRKQFFHFVFLLWFFVFGFLL